MTHRDEYAFEALDTVVDLHAPDAGDAYDGLDTVQEAALPADDLDPTALTQVTGGMKWEQFPRSSHIEDRRSPAAIRRGQRWWDQTHRAPAAAPVPLPPTRPSGQ